ncbi:MAG: transglycosylase SLT domain-containing protein [Nevskia sp.]|nr:transglycosylase SLT domain-containing protein [Nevskia sp.]
MRLLPLIALAGLGAGAWWVVQQQGGASGSGAAATGGAINPANYANLPAYLAVQPIIAAAAGQYGVPGGQPGQLLDNLLYQESTFNPNAVSVTGAQGIAQFEPATAAQYGVDVTDVTSSIYGAAHYLADLYNEFGDWNLAVAAYNGGPGTIQKWVDGTGSLSAQTNNYVARITGYVLA